MPLVHELSLERARPRRGIDELRGVPRTPSGDFMTVTNGGWSAPALAAPYSEHLYDMGVSMLDFEA
jgi:hypothetical protein